MTDTLSPAVPAGWYDDPSSPDAYRWWSGAGWTEHTAPKQAAPAAAPAADLWPAEARTVQQGTIDLTEFSRDPAVQRIQGMRTDLAPIDQAARYARAESAGTPGIWLLAFLPVISLACSGLATLFVLASGIGAVGYIFTPVVIGLAWLFAVLDARALARRGYRPASILWMLLLPPLAYLIARGRAVRAQGGRAWPPELVYFGNVVLIGAAGVVLAFAIPQWIQSQTPSQQSDGSYYAGTFSSSETPTQESVAAMLQTALAPDGSFTVACPQALVERGGSFMCIASDTLSTAQVDLTVELTAAGDVYFTYQIRTDAPAPEDFQANDAGSIGDESKPWRPQIEQNLQRVGEYASVDCTQAEPLIDYGATFNCAAKVGTNGTVMLSVTVSTIGNVSYTEYPLDGELTQPIGPDDPAQPSSTPDQDDTQPA